MSFVKVDTLSQDHKKKSKVSIRPFVAEGKDNMGLSIHNMVVFDGIVHEEPIACIEHNGIKRYVNGLNEYAPELKELSEEEREAKIKTIRSIVCELEKTLASNVLDVESETFWNNVKLLKHDNSGFWEQLVIRPSNEPLFLAPEEDVYDRLKMIAIEAGGFSTVAKSLSHARANGTKYKFYLDKYEETASIKTEVKKLRNKALSLLQTYFDENVNKLLFICKIIDGNSAQYTRSTPNDIMYDNMDNYINGKTVEKDTRRTAKTFIEVASLDQESLIMRSMIKDAHYHRIITVRSDGGIYHTETNSMMGKNASEVLEYLKNPLNDDIYDRIKKGVEHHWN